MQTADHFSDLDLRMAFPAEKKRIDDACMTAPCNQDSVLGEQCRFFGNLIPTAALFIVS